MKRLALLLAIMFVGAFIAFQTPYQHYRNFKDLDGLSRSGIFLLGEKVKSYSQANGRSPHALEEVIGFSNNRSPALEADNLLDPWGSKLKYTLLDKSSFEIRSAGIDGEFNTWDDYAENFSL